MPIVVQSRDVSMHLRAQSALNSNARAQTDDRRGSDSAGSRCAVCAWLVFN
jgi:hypothetical protein